MKIITHSGPFHADDVFGVALMLLLHGEKSEVIRTRDMAVISTGDIVLDVGGIYDTNKNRFDHHQPGGAGTRQNGIPYAAFGLLWKQFGIDACAKYIDSADKTVAPKTIADHIEKKFVQGIDAIDNGVDIVTRLHEDVEPFLISDYVLAFLPSWKEDDENIDERFMKMVGNAKDLLVRLIEKSVHREQGRGEVEKAYAEAPDKRVIALNQAYSWADIISKYSEPLFVIYPKAGTWHAKTVRKDPTKFDSRKDFPAEWAGLREGELSVFTGVEDALFCHPNLFLVGAKTKEGVMKLVQMSLEKRD